MLTLVSYDVPSDRRRTKLAEALKDYGRRVQLSVFECDLDEDRLGRLRARVVRLTVEKEDSVRIYRVCGTCREKVEVIGLGQPPTEEPEVVIL